MLAKCKHTGQLKFFYGSHPRVVRRPAYLLRPETPFEVSLAERMAQHWWLSRRALSLQENCFSLDEPVCEQEKQLALYLRYQTMHERAFERCANELRKLRDEQRRQAAEQRKQELHQWAVLLAEAKIDHQQMLTSDIRFQQITDQIKPSREGDRAVSAEAA